VRRSSFAAGAPLTTTEQEGGAVMKKDINGLAMPLGIHVFVFVLLMLLTTSALADSNQVDFASASLARDYFMTLTKDQNKNWRGGISSHGSTVNTSWTTTTLWSDGSWSQSWGGYHRKSCGTVYAVPTSNFILERCFRYKDLGKIKEGLIVAVEVSIQCTNSNMGKDVYLRTLRNYVESGVNVPSNGKTGAGRIISFKKAVRERFGADGCYYLEKLSGDGRVYVLALGCNTQKANPNIIPQMIK